MYLPYCVQYFDKLHKGEMKQILALFASTLKVNITHPYIKLHGLA